MKKLSKIFLTSIFVFFITIHTSFALTVNQNINFNEINKEIEKIEKNIKKGDFSRDTIDSYVSYLTEQENLLLENRKLIEKQLNFTQKQIDALGEKPQNGTNEDKSITKQRDDLSKKLSEEDRKLKETDLIIIKIDDLTVQILNARNKKVYGSLMTKQSALINPLVFFNGIKQYMIFFWDVVKSPIEWYQNIPSNEKKYTLLSIVSMGLILAISLTIAIFSKKYIISHWGYNKEIENPRLGRKFIAATAVAIARGLIPSFLIGGCLIWMISSKIFNDSLFGIVLMITSFVSLMAIAEATVSRVTFAPYYAQWRLINISDDRALKFTRTLYLFIILNAIAVAQTYIAKKGEYSLDTLHFLMVISCAIKAFFLMLLSKISYDTYSVSETPVVETEQNEEEETSVGLGFKLLVISYMFCLTTFIISILGYPELSLFILNKTISSFIICGVFELLRRSIIDLVKRIIISGPWIKSIKINKKNVNKIEFWLRIILNPLLVIIILFILLNLWGLPGDFILQMTKKLFLGFKIGGIEISIIAIIIGIIVFLGSLSVVKIIKKHLSNNVFDKIDMDDGIKNSLISGVGFIGFIISTLLAIIAVGIDLTNLAFIAGALSVGIGFGLQEVIKNLVSGIIILFERPFKVGDWVIINNTEGKIKQINIRSTEMESFNRTSIIVPNATLLSNAVVNLTHGDNISRQIIKISVAYGSDVEKVREILLESANKHKFVMKNPAPYVIFKDFGQSSLDFELRCYTNDIWKGWIVPSDLRFEINRRFIEEGIEIPFQQIVVHSGEKVTQEEQFYAKKRRNTKKES